MGQVADISLYQQLVQKGRMVSESSWLSLFLNDANLLVRHISDKQIFLGLPSYGGVAGLGWPAKTQEVGGRIWFTLSDSVQTSDVPVLHIHQLDEWEQLVSSGSVLCMQHVWGWPVRRVSWPEHQGP